MADDDEGERRGTPQFSLPWVQRLPTVPHLPLPVAAAITGLVCGLIATLMVWGGERGCDAVRGRPTCGGYGLLMLIGIVVACFLIGVVLLRAFDVDDPGVTTFFGVTLPLLAIVGLLLDYVFDTWMAFALPVIVAVCFVGSAYLAQALEASNPNPYLHESGDGDDSDPTADHEAEDDETRVDGAASTDETTDERRDDLPRYAPSDES